MSLLVMMFVATIEASQPPIFTLPPVSVTRAATVLVVVRTGGGDPRRDRAERVRGERRHPVAVFHGLVTRPLKRAVSGGGR